MIRFVLSVAFADEAELGWDPTMQHVVSDDTVQYRIKVHQQDGGATAGKVLEISYLTSKIIFDYGADTLRGRGTRVFEARQLDANGKVFGPPVAIKDVWVDEDQQREGDIHAQIISEADCTDRTLIKKYFLTVLNHGDVRMDGVVDHTRDLIMRGHEISGGVQFRLPRRAYSPRSYDNPRTGFPSTSDEYAQTRTPHPSHRQFSHKVHYRIVFAEAVQPLHAVTDLSEAFHVLVDVTTGTYKIPP